MNRIDTYADALRWLYGRNQFAIKLGLDGPRRLLEAFGNPQQGLPILHVAGTNGKGSVCANLAAMLSALGFERVGLYTSPHLVSFRERIRVDGVPIPPLWVAEWLRDAMPTLEELNSTYFECATAMAFCWFRAQDCRAVVLETGLGGRLDATTVAGPKVTAITSISMDHTKILGDTVEAIWGEKLGIVKPGIPLIVDEERPALSRLAENAAQAAGAPFLNVAERLEPRPGGFRLAGRFGDVEMPEDLRAEAHQIRNAALSLLTLESFLGKALPPSDAWLPALRGARMAGRTQWLQGDGLLPLLLDGAHNPGGVEALCRYLRASVPGKPRFLFAAMRDKEVVSILRTLRTLSQDIVYLDLGRTFPRALTVLELCASLAPGERAGLKEASMTWESLESWLRPGTGADYAVVCGSLYLLGETIPNLIGHYRGLEEFGRMMEEERLGGVGGP